MVLLGKWCWRMLVEKDGLWYRVLKARYGDGRDTLFWHDIWVGEIPLKLKFPRLFDLALNKESLVVDMVRILGADGEGEGMWRRRLLAWEEESVRECSILLHNIVLQENIHDVWRWSLDPVHDYSVWEAYSFLTNFGELMVRNQVDNIWYNNIPSKVSLFVWRHLRNRLPTKDNLVRWCVLHQNDAVCVSGFGNIKTATHLLLGCHIFSSLWSHVWLWLGTSSIFSSDLRQHFVQVTNMAGLPRFTHSFFTIIWFASMWVIWMETNHHVFQNMASNSSSLIEKVKLYSFLWLKSKQATFSYSYHNWWKHPLLCMGVHL